MQPQFTQLARETIALFSLLVVWVSPLAADVNVIKGRVRDLHADAANVQIRLTDGVKLNGSIQQVEADAFTVIEEKTGQERTLQYSQVATVKKKGLSRGAKAILIPAIIGGSVLLVLCAAPYPIGFLCRSDPS